ncbi:MAG: S-methyl-5'-thioinosine phosphorylase [Chromatiales bacterium]|nr:S-methyl-5'-thioinosine phosphorylase [Chromatiales bacterium]
MSKLAIIGGTGLDTLEGLKEVEHQSLETPYGTLSSPIRMGSLQGRTIYFLPRHGSGHTVPPHKVNYRANIWALKEAGIDTIIAINAVGGISEEMAPGTISIPDQLIDYTWGRSSTYFEDGLEHVTHIDFTDPFCEGLRHKLISTAQRYEIPFVDRGTFAVTQGPRLESRAEIVRLERDGCELVGMTTMPEAALAREQEICYASIAVVANWAAGKSDEEITMAIIEQNLLSGMERVRMLLERIVVELN